MPKRKFRKKEGPPRRSGNAGSPTELVTDAETSARLGRVRQHDTTAEVAVRQALHGLGLRFRINNRDLPGSPDIANRSRKWAVFVHGCFWHRHKGCQRTTSPKRNAAFWQEKFEANQRRDRRVVRKLRGMGFKVVTVWECETDDADRLHNMIAKRFDTDC